jgi:YD repeat-containing protein
LEYTYDAFGSLSEVFGTLAGTVALDRFNENPAKAIAPAPAGASKDGKVRLLKRVDDPFGNVTRDEGPNGGCADTGYDKAYQQLPIVATVFTKRCGVAPLSTSRDFDRGFGVATRTVGPAGTSSLVYDAFGRVAEAYAPDSSLPSIKVAYLMAQDGPVQRVHLQIRTERANYRSVWLYRDGLGQSLLTLREADPGAGDAGKWVGAGLSERTRRGSIRNTYQPWFYNGDPATHPIARPLQPQFNFKYDALGRLIRSFDTTRPLSHQIHHSLSVDHFDAGDLEAGGPHANTHSTIARDGHGRNVTVTHRLNKSGASETRTIEARYLATGEVAAIFRSGTGISGSVVRWMQHDSLGRMVLNAEPNTARSFAPDPASPGAMKAWRYAYDDSGRLVGTSDARGCGKNLFYDPAGRLVAEDYSPCRDGQADYTPPPTPIDGTGTETFFHYDGVEPGQTQDFGVSAAALAGRLVASYDRSAHTRFGWDRRGRIVSVARRLAKPGEPEASLASRYAPWWFRFTTEYDETNRVVARSTGADVSELLGSDGAVLSHRTT